MDVYDRDQHAKREADALNGGEGNRRDARNHGRDTDAHGPGGDAPEQVIFEERIIEAQGAVPPPGADEGMTEGRTTPMGAGPESTRGTGAPGTGQGWNRREWAGEAPAEPSEDQWNKNEWAGEPADPTAEQVPGKMPPGEAGPQGLGHNPGEQHWAGDRRP